MQSIAAGLPPDVAQRIHPDWRKNETDYWAARDSLLSRYADQWVAFADGAVIASGTSPVEIFHAAQQSGKHPYVICVGREHEPCRMRRAAFPYDPSYANEALPLITVEFRKQPNQSGIALEQVIPDTGADATALPWSDCQQLELDPSEGMPGLIGGVGQSSAATLVFSVWAHLDGNDYQCRLQADFGGNDPYLGDWLGSIAGLNYQLRCLTDLTITEQKSIFDGCSQTELRVHHLQNDQIQATAYFEAFGKHAGTDIYNAVESLWAEADWFVDLLTPDRMRWTLATTTYVISFRIS